MSRVPEPLWRSFKVQYNQAIIGWLVKVFLPWICKDFHKGWFMLIPECDLQMRGLKRMKAPFRSRPASRSVSGKRVCSCCHNILGKGAAMIIESLGLCYHLHCFKVRLSQIACRPATLCLESAWLLWALGVDPPLTS